MGRTGVETNIAQAEKVLRQLLLAQDVEGLQPWLSPALFFSDAAGQWLGGHPCLGEWLARRLRLTALEQGPVEMLVCGQLVLVSSDVVRAEGLRWGCALDWRFECRTPVAHRRKMGG